MTCLATAIDLAPLHHLRLRTPQLELRLPTHEDILALFRTAEAGIHPPDEMPFAVPWTDSLDERAFVDFHEGALRTWTPERWEANFVTTLEGRVIGTQSLIAREFARTREVSSGSWLGAAWQGRGLGTEQRAAVLELAFRGLGARAATTGALRPNRASQRVSEKLGYTLVGESTISPRGTPVPHLDYRLEAVDWRCPFRVELEALEPALPLFGVSAAP